MILAQKMPKAHCCEYVSVKMQKTDILLRFLIKPDNEKLLERRRVLIAKHSHFCTCFGDMCFWKWAH